jgi:hypothetical protein
MHTAAAEPCRCGNLADGQPGVVSGHDRPDPFLRRRSQSRGRHTEAGRELLRVLDALVEWFTSLHGLPANWTGERTLFLQRYRKAYRLFR